MAYPKDPIHPINPLHRKGFLIFGSLDDGTVIDLDTRLRPLAQKKQSHRELPATIEWLLNGRWRLADDG